MKRKLTMRERWQWLVALAAVVIVVYLLLPLWVTVSRRVALVMAFAVPPLIHSRRRRRVRR